MTIVASILSIIIGGGLFAFVEFLITRHDNKAGQYKEIFQAIEKLSNKIDALEQKEDERYAVSSRVRILRFADEMQEERRHSKDSWDQCMTDITEYEQYCETHPKFKNNQTVSTVAYLKKGYLDRLEKHDFL